jgi:hypothetical protein
MSIAMRCDDDVSDEVEVKRQDGADGMTANIGQPCPLTKQKRLASGTFLSQANMSHLAFSLQSDSVAARPPSALLCEACQLVGSHNAAKSRRAAPGPRRAASPISGK